MNTIHRSLGKIDFNSSLPSRNMMKGLFLGTIAARATSARRKEEVREILTRDIPAFCIFFYLAPILENLMGFCLDKHSKNKISLIKGPDVSPAFFQKTQNLLKVMNPSNKYKVRSFEDIEAIRKIFQGNEQGYNKLLKAKSSVFLASIALTVGVLGIFIPWLNVQITRKEMLNQKQGKNLEQVV